MIQLYFDSYKSSTDWQWNGKCKNYIQLDQLKKIKRTNSRLKREIKQKIIYYTNMEDTGWLLEMVLLLGVCGFKLHGTFILFIKFLYATCLQKKALFFSSHNKIWRYGDANTALWQNQIILIVYSIFLKCLNKLLCLVNVFWKKKKHKKQILLSCLPIVVVEQYYHISQKMTFHRNPYLAF